MKIVSIRIIFLAGMLCLSACASQQRANQIAAEAGKDAAGLYAVGQGFERAGDIPGALSMYTQALASDPTFWKAEIAVVEMLNSLGRHDRALQVLQDMRTRHPDNRQIDKLHAITLSQNHQFAEALMLALDLNTTAPDDPEILDLLGKLSEVTGNSTGAKSYYDQALALSPDNPVILSNLAFSFALEGAYDTAVALMQPLFASATTNNLGKVNLALVYALSGQADTAAELANAIYSQEKALEMVQFFKILAKLPQKLQAEAVLFDGLSEETLQKYAANDS